MNTTNIYIYLLTDYPPYGWMLITERMNAVRRDENNYAEWLKLIDKHRTQI